MNELEMRQLFTGLQNDFITAAKIDELPIKLKSSWPG